MKIWQRVDWKAPGQTEPLKYSWKLVRPYVREDELDEWLEIYRRDHPGVEFVASPTRPRGKSGPKIMKGPGMTHATKRHHATKVTEGRLVDATIVDRFDTKRTGRAVMRGPYGWVLNMGGRHGTPGIATDDNVVAVKG